MKGINLLVEKNQYFRRQELTLILSLAGVLLISFFSLILLDFFISQEINQLKKHKSRLVSHIDSLSSAIKKREEEKQQVKKLEDIKVMLSSRHEQIKKIVNFSNDLKSVTSTGFFFDKILYADSCITINGFMSSKQLFAKIIKNFQDKYSVTIRYRFKTTKNNALSFDLIVCLK